MVQSFHKVIDGIIIGVVGQIGSYTEPPGQEIAGVFTFSLNATRQIEDGNHADELGSLLSRRTDKAGGFAVIFHLFILPGAAWVGLEFFRSLPANSEERSGIDPSANASCP